MRIGIDARFLTHPQPGGFKTYTENLISALARVDSENEYILYTDRPFGNLVTSLNNSNIQGRVVSGELPFIGVPWREQTKLLNYVKKDRIDLFHSPCMTAPMNLPCPLVVTVHDMIWAFPKNFTSRNSWSLKRRFIDWYNYIIPKYSIRHAAAIITVSQASKKSIVESLGMKPELVTVTYEAAGSSFQPISDMKCLEAVRNKYNLSSDYILALGSADPRKNIKSLIAAYGQLPTGIKEKYQLAIIWTHPFLSEELSKQVVDLGLENCVRFLRQVSNEDLVLLYNSASLFVFPSRYEGFGLPLLEAMACGVPVVAANNSSIPEVVGDAGLLVDAQDPNGLAEAIFQVLTDKDLELNLRKKGHMRATQFSWDRCGRETIAVYNNILNMEHRRKRI